MLTVFIQVMKKSKLSSVPSENSSPLFDHKVGTVPAADNGMTTSSCADSNDVMASSPADVKAPSAMVDNNYETIDRKAVVTRRRNSSGRDPGYETIPGERCKKDLTDSLNATMDGDAHHKQSVTKLRISAPAGKLLICLQIVLLIG